MRIENGYLETRVKERFIHVKNLEGEPLTRLFGIGGIGAH